MEKSSFSESKRASRIRELLKLEGLKQKDLADRIDTEPQNLSRCLQSGKVSEKMCRKIGKCFPKYNVLWLLGDSDLMLIEDVRTDFIRRSDATNEACLQILDSALREVCLREGIEIPTLENIPEILLLQGQLRDFADSLMWNYVRHRGSSHFWGTLEQLDASARRKPE